MSKMDKLVSIWQKIPSVVTKQLDLSQKEIIERYVDVFHIGAYFYVIFNTQTAAMEYVDSRVQDVLGIQPEEFSLEFVLESLHSDDLPYYYHYEQSAVRFFSTLSQEHFFKYKFSYDYRLRMPDGSYKRLMQQIVPILYFPEGGARTLGIFTDLNHLDIQGIPKLSFIGMAGAPSYYNVHLQENFFPIPSIFTKTEQQILALMVQGHTTKEIAQKLSRSSYTIQTHRKNILRKSKCQKLQELLVKSVREGWV